MSEKRILLRSGKDPLKVVSAENTLQSNLIGNNSGNLLFSTAATRLLSVPGTTVVANGLGPNPQDADEINDTYDVVVLPFANAFRPSFERRLKKFTEMIERLRIPVVVLSSGAQSTADYDFERLRPIEDTVREFARAVLDRSASIGVRGEFTEAFLNRLGFKDVEVVGCPSMFLFGGPIQVKKREWPGAEALIAVNASSSDEAFMGPVISAHMEKYSRLYYVAQDRRELEQLLWGQSVEAESRGSEFPYNAGHPLHEEDRVRFLIDPWTWLEWMRSIDFSFGTRIHGNLIALLAGTPAYVLAHDSRTLELARYFEVPHRRLSESDSCGIDAEDLYVEADFSKLEQGQHERTSRMIAFLERNGLDHTLSDQTGGRAFEDELAAVAYPPAVRPAIHADSRELLRRVRWLRSRQQKAIDGLQERVAALEARAKAKDC